ncbi:MAG: hypothetical protein ACP5XB_30155, partial [Isosphaeraceae bacterium]
MESPAESAARKLAWEMGTWKSIEIQWHSDDENEVLVRQDQPRTFKQTCRYIETAAGQRLYELRLTSDSDQGTTFCVDYTDGRQCADVFRI